MHLLESNTCCRFDVDPILSERYSVLLCSWAGFYLLELVALVLLDIIVLDVIGFASCC